MRTFQGLRQILAQVRDNKYSMPAEVDLENLVEDMLHFLGDTDPELRDDLICSTFYTWTEDGTLTTSLMHKILNTCISEKYLFLGIGEKDTDTVFTRAFSSLYIGLALCRHDEDPYLSDAEVQNVKQALLNYVKQEKDFRGYVTDKGWAHALAHVSDALNDLVFCDCLLREDLLDVLNAVKAIVLDAPIVYQAGEDDRVAVVFESICERDILSPQDILNWLRTFDYPYDRTAGVYPQVFYSHVNRRHFLRCIYFMLLALDGFEAVAAYIKEMLKRIESSNDDSEE